MIRCITYIKYIRYSNKSHNAIYHIFQVCQKYIKKVIMTKSVLSRISGISKNGMTRSDLAQI